MRFYFRSRKLVAKPDTTPQQFFRGGQLRIQNSEFGIQNLETLWQAVLDRGEEIHHLHQRGPADAFTQNPGVRLCTAVSAQRSRCSMALANQAAAVPAQGAWSGRRPCQSPFAGRG